MSATERLRKSFEEKQIALYKKKFQRITCGNCYSSEDMPKYIEQAVEESLHLNTAVSSSIDVEESEKKVSEWTKALVEQSGVGAKFFLMTPFRYFRWIICEAKGEDWVLDLIEISELDTCLISENKDKMLAFHNEEHNYVAQIFDLTTGVPIVVSV